MSLINSDSIISIHQYQVIDIIGRGGTSTVYKAKDNRLNRIVALKLLHSHLANKPDFQSRFLAEGRALTSLTHPHILHVYEVGLYNGQPFMAMEYLSGDTLRHWLDKWLSDDQLLPIIDIFAVGRQIAQALDEVHIHGLVHRDVKPDNILLKVAKKGTAPTDEIFAVLIDFGIAKQVSGSGSANVTGELLGTLAYMAPEQFNGQPFDQRYDIYSLGVMLYELVTGQQPFEGASVMDYVTMHQNNEPEPIQNLRPDVPAELVTLISRAMAKDPNQRFQSVREVAWGLEILARTATPSTQIFASPMREAQPREGPLTIHDTLPMLDPPIIPVDILSEGTDDQIIVTPLDGRSWAIPIEKTSLIGGRDATSTIYLNDLCISRQHFRVDVLPDGQLVVVDLGSLNGLFLDDRKLERHMITLWQPTQSLKVGTFWLTQRLAKSPLGSVRRQVLAVPRTLEVPIGAQTPAHQNATLRLTPSELSVEPGSSAQARISVTNHTHTRQVYQVNVQGIPRDWVTMGFSTLTVDPGETTERMIAFHPPRAPTSAAQDHDYRLMLISQGEKLESVPIAATLRVFPYYASQCEVVSNDHVANVIIMNTGNSQRTYIIEAREAQNHLILMPSRTRLLLQAGQSATTPIRLQARHRPLIGLGKAYPVDFFVRSDGQHPQTPRLRVTIQPWISWREIVVVCVLLVSVLLIRVAVVH